MFRQRSPFPSTVHCVNNPLISVSDCFVNVWVGGLFLDLKLPPATLLQLSTHTSQTPALQCPCSAENKSSHTGEGSGIWDLINGPTGAKFILFSLLICYIHDKDKTCDEVELL